MTSTCFTEPDCPWLNAIYVRPTARIRAWLAVGLLRGQAILSSLTTAWGPHRLVKQPEMSAKVTWVGRPLELTRRTKDSALEG